MTLSKDIFFLHFPSPTGTHCVELMCVCEYGIEVRQGLDTIRVLDGVYDNEGKEWDVKDSEIQDEFYSQHKEEIEVLRKEVVVEWLGKAWLSNEIEPY